MIALDDPRHTRLRNIVRSAFTPRVLGRIEESVRDRAHRLVAAMVADNPDGTADFVASLAGPLPLQIICDMMGIPESDHQKVFGWTNVILGFGDPEITADFDEFARVAMDIGAYAAALADDRRARPGDDLTTSLVQAELDGQRLTSSEVASFFILLVVAGNETTRNAISHGLLALSRHPEQRDDWWSDFDAVAPTAVEEVVRWASPVAYMRRTVTRETELSGVTLAEGDKVTLWYGSANRDERKFSDPWTFDVRRHPNPHLGFGGGLAHFCLGANLARREITVAFEELHRMTPTSPPPRNRPGCSRRSSTESSDCRSPGVCASRRLAAVPRAAIWSGHTVAGRPTGRPLSFFGEGRLVRRTLAVLATIDQVGLIRLPVMRALFALDTVLLGQLVRSVGIVLAAGIQRVGTLPLRVELFTRRCGLVTMAGGPVAQPGGFGGLGLGFRRGGPSLGLGLGGDGLPLLDAVAVGAGLLADAVRLGPALLVARATRHEGERQDQQQDHHDCHDDQDDGVVHAGSFG